MATDKDWNWRWCSSIHFSHHNCTHLPKSSAGKKQQGLRVKAHTILSKGYLGGKRETMILNLLHFVPHPTYSLPPARHLSSVCSEHVPYRPQNILPPFKNKSCLDLKTHAPVDLVWLVKLNPVAWREAAALEQRNSTAVSLHSTHNSP